jgi:hypothetical protein
MILSTVEMILYFWSCSRETILLQEIYFWLEKDLFIVYLCQFLINSPLKAVKTSRQSLNTFIQSNYHCHQFSIAVWLLNRLLPWHCYLMCHKLSGKLTRFLWHIINHQHVVFLQLGFIVPNDLDTIIWLLCYICGFRRLVWYNLRRRCCGWF